MNNICNFPGCSDLSTHIFQAHYEMGPVAGPKQTISNQIQFLCKDHAYVLLERNTGISYTQRKVVKEVSDGGYMSVDRDSAIKKNWDTIQELTLPEPFKGN